MKDFVVPSEITSSSESEKTLLKQNKHTNTKLQETYNRLQIKLRYVSLLYRKRKLLIDDMLASKEKYTR